MDKNLIDAYAHFLKDELQPALGCTEPIALAYAGAVGWAEFDAEPSAIDAVDIYCSGNIIKNVMGVTVPNTGGLKGIDVATACGICGGDALLRLEVLSSLDEESIEQAVDLCESGKVKVHLVEGEENLYIRVEIKAGQDHVATEIVHNHTHINKIIKNGEVLLDNTGEVLQEKSNLLPESCSIKEILDLAEAINFSDYPKLIASLKRQINYNKKIAEQGLADCYGAEIGRSILEAEDADCPEVYAKALAAAGSDARMGGCGLPVVINSGSGNQGMTVSLPVLAYAERRGIFSEDRLLRALLVANLVAIHQKRYIGKLSAYCGVVSAATAAGVGIAYLKGSSYEVISRLISNNLATVGGIVCDGAKASCASKVAQSIDSMFLSLHMAEQGRGFEAGDGLVGYDVEETIKNFGRMAKEGMKGTDVEILNIMIAQKAK